MAKLEQLRPSVYDMTDEQLTEFVSSYRSRRLAALSVDELSVIRAKRKTSVKAKTPNLKIMLTSEEKELAKLLGISFKVMLAQKQKKAEEEE